jgi:hypothetical protein
MPVRIFPLLPAILAAVAAVTDVVTTIVFMVYLRPHQPPGYPVPFLIFQILTIGFALLLAAPVRWVWLPAFLLPIAGTLLGSMPIALLYVPTGVVAGWVMVRRLESSKVDQPV